MRLKHVFILCLWKQHCWLRKHSGGWKPSHWTGIHYSLILRAAASCRIWLSASKTTLPYVQRDSFAQAEPLHLGFLLTKQAVLAVVLTLLMYWCLFHGSRLYFTEFFKRSVPGKWMSSISWQLATTTLISRCMSHLLAKVQRTISIWCLWYDRSQTHQKTG